MSAPLTVLVTEPVLGRFRAELTRHGDSPHRWIFTYGEDDRALALAPEADVLVCAMAGPELLARATRLRLLQVAGAGLDRVPLERLDPAVTVANTFHHGRSIAEHVLMVTMMLLRRVGPAERDLRSGVWSNVMVDQTRPFGGLVAGRTFGLVGFGEIGGQVALLAGRLDARVRTVRKNPDGPVPDGVVLDWVGGPDQLGELLAGSDVVVVTVPLDESTRGLVGAAELAAMPAHALLVNVARGPVVDEAALHRALAEGSIAGAAIDVWWRNPRAPGAPAPSQLDFTGFPNVVLTPHQSGHTAETFAGRSGDITGNVDALAAGEPLVNVVRGPGAGLSR